MLENKLKVVIVMPAYNAARTVRDTFNEIPKHLRENIILVDDGSKDNTVEVAKKLGIKVFEHPSNLGYGGNQKTCYWEALKLNPDIVVMLHPDYQYDASLIGDLISPIAKERYDFMFGSRIANKKTALAGGMPKLKYYVNRLVCFAQNILLGTNFTEQFSGFRAFSRKLLETVPFGRFSNDFVFDQEMTVSALSYGFAIGEIAIPTRYHQKASSIKFFKGAKFILDGFYTIARYALNANGFIDDVRFKKATKKVGINIFFLLLLGLLSLITYQTGGILKTVVVFSLSTLVYVFYQMPSTLRTPRLVAFSIVVFAALCLMLVGNFDNNLFVRTGLETNQKIIRNRYFSEEFGKIYLNQFGFFFFDEVLFYLQKISAKLSDPLSAQLYFYAIHPTIYPIFLLPMFLVGLRNFMCKRVGVVIAYLLPAFAVSILATATLGVYIYIPLINFSIAQGVFWFYSLLRKNQ